MMRDRFAVTAPRAKPTPDGLNPIDGQMRATRHGSTPRAAQAIPACDHFAQRNRQRQVIAYHIDVIRLEHLTTFMQPRAASPQRLSDRRRQDARSTLHRANRR
jgi:hypothetical protein